MRQVTLALAASLAAALQVGCSAPDRTTGPRPSTAPAASRGLGPDDGVRRIEMLDACDPTSFDAALGAGTCTRPGGVSLTTFLDQLARQGSAAAWRFSPPQAEVRVGELLLAINRGGETHTFTEVEAFGGGIVPRLNELSGNPAPAPECQRLEADDFVPPGGTYTDRVSEAGTERYQCCIHPWMRTVVHARGE